MNWVSVECVQEPAGWFRNRFGKVPEKIWEAVFGFGWDTASLGRHVMCSEVVKSPQSTRTIFCESQRGCMRTEVENYF
jgi:hypothetical protein